jgi:hypothetical protein
MYSEIQRERADIGGLMARPEYREWNPELIKPKKLLNPVKASRSHQELHRELLMNHRRWDGAGFLGPEGILQASGAWRVPSWQTGSQAGLATLQEMGQRRVDVPQGHQQKL